MMKCLPGTKPTVLLKESSEAVKSMKVKPLLEEPLTNLLHVKTQGTKPKLILPKLFKISLTQKLLLLKLLKPEIMNMFCSFNVLQTIEMP